MPRKIQLEILPLNGVRRKPGGMSGSRVYMRIYFFLLHPNTQVVNRVNAPILRNTFSLVYFGIKHN